VTKITIAPAAPIYVPRRRLIQAQNDKLEVPKPQASAGAMRQCLFRVKLGSEKPFVESLLNPA